MCILGIRAEKKVLSTLDVRYSVPFFRHACATRTRALVVNMVRYQPANRGTMVFHIVCVSRLFDA